MSAPTLKPRQARVLLARMDVPDCDCPLLLSCPCGQSCTGGAALTCPHCRGGCRCKPLLCQDPCHHALGRDHGLSLEEWGELQRALCPQEYTDPPDPPAPAQNILSRAARVEVYRRRRGAGRGLWHEGDQWRTQPTDDTIRVGVEAVRERNGADSDGAIRRAA